MALSTEIFVKLCPVLGKGTITPSENKDADVLPLSAAVNAVKSTTKIHSFRFICISMCPFIFLFITKNSYLHQLICTCHCSGIYSNPQK